MRLDSDGQETAALRAFAGGLAGRRVLEVGCGDGRLTWKYAAGAARVVGLDPKPEKIARARASTPPHLAGRVEFHAVALEDFPARPGEFDRAVLAWSL